MGETPLRVVIAEDNYLVREGTARLLEMSGEVEVLAAVGSAPELLEAVERLAPDAVITDIRMPPGHKTEGIDAAHALRAAHPTLGVVVLSQYGDPTYASKLLKDGAAGLAYLLKDRIGDYEGLLRALREVVAGRSVIDPDVVEALVGVSRRATASPISRLTSRELEVLSAMAEGNTNGAIAETLHLSDSAVEKYINVIFAKLDLPPEAAVHRRVSAVLTYLRATDH
ncbi:MAG: response regulator transcription factor [Acidimicrobiia bacterium]